MQAGTFKAPLFHRLAGFEIRLPPLRKRREDIGRLLIFFIEQITKELSVAPPMLQHEDSEADPWIPAELGTLLTCYHWPGNVREFRNVVRRLVVENRDRPQLTTSPALREMLKPVENPRPSGLDEEINPKEMGAPVSSGDLEQVLSANHWDFAATARSLGVSRATVYEWVKRSPSLRTAADLSAQQIVQALSDREGDVDSAAQHLKVSSRALRRRMRSLDLVAESGTTGSMH